MKPVLQAILVADNVYVDQRTGKKVVAGIFHTLQFLPRREQQPTESRANQQTNPKPMMMAGSPTAYISLTEVREATQLDLRYVDLEDNSILFSATATLRVEEGQAYDPLATIEVVIPLPVLLVPHKGHYAFELLTNGELIGSHRIQAEEIQEDESK